MSDATKPKLCFVVGPIGHVATDVRKHADMMLNAVIREVLANPPFDMRVKRADEDADPGMIGDRILNDVMHADLVVADLTDLNPNAFYELGIRHAAQKPTIHIAREGTILPFDNLSHRTIFIDVSDWKSIVSGREVLGQATEAVLARGYKVNNPVTQANASFKMQSSKDPTEQLIGSLQARIDALESQQNSRWKNINSTNALLDSMSNDSSIYRLFTSAVGKAVQDLGPDHVAADIHQMAARYGLTVRSAKVEGNAVDVQLSDGRHFAISRKDRA